MTETLQDRLRHGAKNIYSIGPVRAADLLNEAAACFDHDAKVEANMAKQVAARRAFLERAVCHPGPPLSETEDYDPEAPLGELEAAVLERMDLELKAERDLWDIRKLCEQALGRTPDPARTTIQVVRDLLAQPTTMQRLNEQRRDLRAAERAAAGLVPIVRPEHFAGPFPAISGYVKRTAEARAATIDQALRMLKDGQRLAVHDEPERVDILFLDPGQEPPLGQTWTVYEMNPDMTLGSLRTIGGDPEGGLASATGSDGAASEPAARRALAVLIARDAACDTHPEDCRCSNCRAREAAGHAAAEQRQREEDAAVRLRRTMAEASAEHEGDDATRRMYRPGSPVVTTAPAVGNLPAEYMTPEQVERRRDEEAADRMRRAVTYRPGSPIPEQALSRPDPLVETLTPEEEAEREERLERFDHDWE